MSITGTTWEIVLKKQLSVGRIVGMGLFWTWMMVTFYSIVPYLRATNVRATLYSSQLFSLVAMVGTMLFVALAVRRGGSLTTGKPVVFGSAAAMFAGTALTMFADSATVNGTLLLGFGSVLTGSGSAVMLLGWVEVLSWQGERLALVELAASSSLAFVAAFALMLVPAALADAVCVALCAASAAALLHFGTHSDAATFQADEQAGAGHAELSRQTMGLFAKALVGVALVGMVAGFFDVLSGYQTFMVQDAYGLWLYLAGLLASLALATIAIFLHHDGTIFGYRFCMLLICLGCLLTPFLAQSSNVGVLIFGGYHTYDLVLCAICIGIAASFRTGVVRTVGLGYVALYGGELVGSLAAHGLGAMGDAVIDLALLTLTAVSALFVSHLFLFTEADLVKLGIGEVNLSTPARRKLEELGGKLPAATLAGSKPHTADSFEPNRSAIAAGQSQGATVTGAFRDVPQPQREPHDAASPGKSAAGGNDSRNMAQPQGASRDASDRQDVPNAQRYMGCAVVTAVADALTSELLSAGGQGAPIDSTPAKPVDPAAVMVERFGLSPRESDVLPLLLEGRTIARIQEALFISQGTVSTHIRHIYQKTNTRNRQELIDLAHRISEA